MAGDRCIFKFLRRGVDGKHLMRFRMKTPFSNFSRIVCTGSKKQKRARVWEKVCVYMLRLWHQSAPGFWPSSSVPSLRMENGAANHVPPRYPVCCRQFCLNPRVETHCHSLFLHSPSPCFFQSSSLTFPFWCPCQGNSWEAAVAHAQHVPYPCPPPFPN